MKGVSAMSPAEPTAGWTEHDVQIYRAADGFVGHPETAAEFGDRRVAEPPGSDPSSGHARDDPA
jgi:hypothetical protein